MPFTGLEFGELVLKENVLEGVKITDTDLGDHYDLENQEVRVLEERLSKKSITAISVVAHEIGHAIQHKEKYKALEQRTSLVKNTAWISQIGRRSSLFGNSHNFSHRLTRLDKNLSFYCFLICNNFSLGSSHYSECRNGCKF